MAPGPSLGALFGKAQPLLKGYLLRFGRLFAAGENHTHRLFFVNATETRKPFWVIGLVSWWLPGVLLSVLEGSKGRHADYSVVGVTARRKKQNTLEIWPPKGG